MNIVPMGFGRGKKKTGGATSGNLFDNVNTSSSVNGLSNGGGMNGGSNSFANSNGGFTSGGGGFGGGGGGFSSGGGGGGGFGGGGNSFGGGGDDLCRSCNQPGHYSRDCPNKGSGGADDGCRICHESGHFARECPNKPAGGDGCRVCGEDGHFARECPNKGEEKCFRCQETGHRVADCPQEADPNRPAPVTYVPTYDTSEATLFSNGLNSGINFKKYHDIPVKVEGPGKERYKKVDKFHEVHLGDQLQSNIKRSGYEVPTPIQKHALPIIVGGEDVMAAAQTGSGKTAAFVLPMIKVICDKGPSSSAFSMSTQPDALVITPTRELAIQIYNETNKFAFNTIVKAGLAYGGASVSHQRNQMRNGCNILIGTPGRLKMFIEDGTVNMEKIKFLVLDEADRMLDMGFKGDMEFFARHSQMPSCDLRQTLLFSATLPEEVQRIAKDFLKQRYLFIAVGIIGAAESNVQQLIEEVDGQAKMGRIKDLLRDLGRTAKVLIFVKTKKSADFLSSLLSQADLGATSIHGDRQQREREEALRDFRTGSHPILVATSVAARGLDIPGVTHVINYDMPDDISEYVHRIGRTGRAGNTGIAISFFDASNNSDMARDLIKTLSDAQQDVPKWLEAYSTSCGGGSGWNSSSNGFGGSDYRSGNNSGGGNFGGGGWNANDGPEADELW